MKISIQIDTEGAQAEEFAAALLEHLGTVREADISRAAAIPTAPAAPMAMPATATEAEPRQSSSRKPGTPTKPRQGEKTSAIREFLAAHPNGIAPKEILAHLRRHYPWAAEAKSLANTVHTTLNNLQDRSEVVVVAADKGRLYKLVPRTTAPALPAADIQTPAGNA